MSPRVPGDPDKGKVDEVETDAAAADSKEAAAVEEGAQAEETPKPRRRRKTTPQAEGTAAEETGVGKDAAQAALQEGSGEPVAAEPVDEAEDVEEAVEEPAAAEDAEEAAPAPARRRRGRRAAAEEPAEPAPAPARQRRERAPGELVTVRAHAKYVRTSARKARLVCDHIRGKSVQEARAILAHTPRAVARDWSKLLESAVANAEHNHELVGDELRIQSVTADEGPTLKRFRPRAMGRATRIRKRTSHLTITLTPKG
jgi:ribosomal protein L22